MRSISPDLIISQYYTDDLDGRSVFLHLLHDQALEKYRHVPYILLSDPDIRDKYMRELHNLGLRGWFTAPAESTWIREILENILLTRDNRQYNLELQQEIKRSQYRYRDLLENANDLIFTLDENGYFTYLNNRFTPLTGWQKEEWHGKPFLTLIDHRDRDTAINHYQMAHQGKARIFEAVILGNASISPVLSFNITPIFDKGNIVGSIGIARDVTDQKKMEREILDLKNFNESIIRSMEAGLLTIDLEGKITSFNGGAEQILGWEAAEVLGKSMQDVLKPGEVQTILSKPPSPGSPSYIR